ncbi:putative squalene monooxygenase [Medicago truncatula]|nr:squalene monooxygenase SE1-like [Medicago truncatula]RHN46252.1 putative squalene monooxygenase [Medicago truncatula]
MDWLEISWDELRIKERIGAGSFGTVYRAEWHGSPVASTINTLVGTLHKVFGASPDPACIEMHPTCFDYLSLGGVCSDGPIALLSGLNSRPLSLVLHFFALAVYGVGRLLIPFPSPK